MTTNLTKDGQVLTVAIEGRIDTQTSPELQTAIEGAIGGITELILDFSKVEYISSAGLRIILIAENKMTSNNGSMVIKNAGKNILDVFKVTGFDSFLTLE